MHYAGNRGINIIDCWMSDPKSRNIIGEAMFGNREKWYAQRHLGSTLINDQHVRIRDMKYVKPAFEDLLAKLRTDYTDIGMIHYMDTKEDWASLQDSGFMKYILELREKGTVRHIGLSSHNPKTAKLAAQSGIVNYAARLKSPSRSE